MILRSIKNLIFIAILVTIVTPGSTKAYPIESLNFASTTDENFPGYTVGWTFHVSTPITVRSLGYFDDGALGFTQPHPVGIWDNTGTSLLASTTVVSTDSLVPSTGSQPSNGFRYEPIASVYLAPGDYVVGGLNSVGSGDGFYDFGTGTTTAPGITYGEGRFTGGGSATSLAYPSTTSDRGISYFGPSFQFEKTVGISVNLDAGQGAVGSNTAGVVPLNGWNDVVGTIVTAPLTDNSGNPSGLSITVPAANITSSGANFPAQPGDTAMMTGHVYNGPGVGTMDLAFTGSVPYQNFDLYVYYNSGAVTNTQTFQLLNSSLVSVATAQVGFENPGSDSAFVLSTGSNNANYVVFKGLTRDQLGADFLIRSTRTDGNYSYFNGLQIVQVPEPSSLVLALAGMIGVARLRRCRNG